MPNIGEIKQGQAIGRCPKLHIWQPCLDCGKERWVLLHKGKPENLRCVHCARQRQVGIHHPHWKGGRTLNHYGYIDVFLPSDDFFYPMANKNHYVAEHRLVMAKHLNRCLLPWEIVHHKNGIKDDNRIENLELLPTNKYHIVDTATKARLIRLQQQVNKQSREIRLLKWHILELVKMKEVTPVNRNTQIILKEEK